MNSTIAKIQTVKGEQKLIPRLLDQLLADLETYQIGSIERIDRIVLYRDLIAYQSALRAEEFTACRSLLNELRPKSIPSHSFREPTLAELQSTDWDDIDCEEKESSRSDKSKVSSTDATRKVCRPRTCDGHARNNRSSPRPARPFTARAVAGADHPSPANPSAAACGSK